jgi:hypothetical protein
LEEFVLSTSNDLFVKSILLTVPLYPFAARGLGFGIDIPHGHKDLLFSIYQDSNQKALQINSLADES